MRLSQNCCEMRTGSYVWLIDKEIVAAPEPEPNINHQLAILV